MDKSVKGDGITMKESLEWITAANKGNMLFREGHRDAHRGKG